MGKANVLTTCRPIDDIEQTFENHARLEIVAQDADIEKLVMEHIGGLGRTTLILERDDDLKRRVTVEIIRASSGMFLLAKLNMDSLRGRLTKKAVLDALTSLSYVSLDKAYADALTRIESQGEEACRIAK